MRHTRTFATASERRSTEFCMNAGIDAATRGVLFVAALVLTACEHPAPYDPETSARSILRECTADAACVHERWRRDPRGWGLGLRAEVAGPTPQSPLIVETTREIAAPDLADTTCAVAPAGAAFDYRTSVMRRGSGEFALALFRWDSYEEALVGHRQVVALVARARGEEPAMWSKLAAQTSLDRACLRFRGQRDRCEPRS
jgi:hypothetical protein